jgi:prepilin-type N-terminal cleavage/methylation domain-containing protein
MDPRRTARAGFTLIELLAVIAILGLLMTLAVPLIGKARASANSRACQSNLRQIASNLQLWADDRNKGNWPRDQGIKFLLRLVHDGELSSKDFDIFRCPATSDVTNTPDDPTPGSGFKDWDNLDKNCISYAGRDGKNIPVNKNKLSDEAIAADDNDRPGGNHAHITNVVYGDAHVGTVDVNQYKADLPENAEFVPVGPESPDPDLKKLLIE